LVWSEPYNTVQVRRATYSRKRYLTSPSPTGRSISPYPSLLSLLSHISIFVGSQLLAVRVDPTPRASTLPLLYLGLCHNPRGSSSNPHTPAHPSVGTRSGSLVSASPHPASRVSLLGLESGTRSCLAVQGHLHALGRSPTSQDLSRSSQRHRILQYSHSTLQYNTYAPACSLTLPLASHWYLPPHSSRHTSVSLRVRWTAHAATVHLKHVESSAVLLDTLVTFSEPRRVCRLDQAIPRRRHEPGPLAPRERCPLIDGDRTLTFRALWVFSPSSVRNPVVTVTVCMMGVSKIWSGADQSS
jgi:hypothetical protein